MIFTGKLETYKIGSVGTMPIEDCVVDISVERTEEDGTVEIAFDIGGQRRYLHFLMQDLIRAAIKQTALLRPDGNDDN